MKQMNVIFCTMPLISSECKLILMIWGKALSKLGINGVVNTFVFRSKSVGIMSPSIQEMPNR